MLPPRSRTTAPRRIRVPIFLLSVAPAIRCVSRVSGQTLYYKRYGNASQTQSAGRAALVLRLQTSRIQLDLASCQRCQRGGPKLLQEGTLPVRREGCDCGYSPCRIERWPATG